MKSARITWAPTALYHFENWIRYIARDSVRIAKRERQKILKSVAHLKNFPQSGRIVPEFQNPALREIIHKPIRIIYKLKNNQIRILALHHSRRELDLSLFP